MRKQILLNFFLLNTITAIFAPSAKAIVNGTPERAWDHPGVIRLVMFREKLAPADVGTRANLRTPNRCTGFAISDSIVLTAGHCIHDETGHTKSVVAVEELGPNHFKNSLAEDFYTPYKWEEIPQDQRPGPVPDCSKIPKPLYLSKTLDIAMIRFPKGTFQNWVQIDLNDNVGGGQNIKLFGYGSHESSFTRAIMHLRIQPDELRSTLIPVWKKSRQRLALVNPPFNGFADVGDSGGPAFDENENKVVGVISTVEERCDTELGQDYAILNGTTVFSSAEAKAFLENAFKRMKNFDLWTKIKSAEK